MKLMKTLKRILCMILCVAVLSLTVGTKWFDANHMEKVEAASVVVAGGLTAATIAEICLFIGGLALSAYGLGEAYENREDIARFGKEFIDGCATKVDGWVLQAVDAYGQDYVFGSEALDLVRDTGWSVIQGGLPPEGDPNKKDDKDKDKFHLPGNPMEHIIQTTTLGATWFAINAKSIYQDWCDILDGWVGKDTPMPQNNVLANNFPKGFTPADVEAQFSGNAYACTAYFRNSYLYDNVLTQNFYAVNDTVNYPVAAYLTLASDLSVKILKSVKEYGVYRVYPCYLNGSYEVYKDGALNRSGNSEIGLFVSALAVDGNPVIYSYGTSFPVFPTMEATESYLLTGQGYEDALNYAKEYRIADWLQEDWAGVLIDPLVNIGLTLSQLIDVCKALGLKTVQGLTAHQLLDLLKKSLPQANPGLVPGIQPSPTRVNPDVDPIYYPEPDTHPAKPPRPVIRPEPEPSPKPDPVPTPDPVPKPDPVPEPDPSPKPDPVPADKVVPGFTDMTGKISVDLKGKFPFCIPWDVHRILTFLSGLSETRARGPGDGSGRSASGAPVFTLPIRLPRLGIDETVEVDLSPFTPVSRLSRLLNTLLFVYCLINLTIKILPALKED